MAFSNPFYSEPPNVLQALMSGVQGYKQGQEFQQQLALNAAGEAFSKGDYDGATNYLFQAGKLDTALGVMKLRQQQQAGVDFGADLSRILSNGQQPSPAQPVAPQANTSPLSRLMNITQPPGNIPANGGPVPSSPKVWGDKEAQDAGLYEPAPNARAVQPGSSIPNVGGTQPAQQPQPSAQGSAPVLPAATLGGASLQQAIPILLKHAGNPNLPPEQRTVITEMLRSALDETKLPPDQKDYYLYRSQGGTDPYTDWYRKNKQAGATAITNDMRGENAEAAEIGKGAGQRANTTMSAANAATKTLQNLSRIDGLLNNVAQGKLEPARMTVSAWAKSFGLDDSVAEKLGLDPKKVGDAQALQALTNEAVLGKIGAGGLPANNFSDADREFLVGTAQRLGNDPRGNQIISEVARRTAQRDIEKAKDWMAFRRDPANKGRSYDDFEIGWADKVSKQDLFGDLRKSAESLLGQPQPAASAAPAPAAPSPSGGKPPMPGAMRSPIDGEWYVPDVSRPGKFQRVEQ